MSSESADPKDREMLILDAVIRLLGQSGISGVSMRAVAAEAGVSLGLVNYYYTDKIGLIAAALRRIEAHDIALLEPNPELSPDDQLRTVLRQIIRPEFLSTDYLSLRLQLWALAPAHESFAEINTAAQKRYRAGLAKLIRVARPDLARAECARRAADIDVVQNGVWLTALLGLDKASIRRAIALSEDIALG